MQKTLYWLIPVVLILVGVAFFFTGKKSNNIPPPLSEASDLQTIPTDNTAATTTDVNQTNDVNATSTTSTATVQPPDLSLSKTPTMIINKNKTYTAKMKTSAGEIDITLNAAATPITVNNFVFLAKKNFYDNTIFHRVIKGFMIQGGDPNGNGTGGPGYQFDDELFTGEYTRGTIAMANSGPNTNGSQFFIMQADVPLPKNYVIFGKVTKGLDVVDKIATAPVEDNGMGETSKPVTPVTVLSVMITER